MKHFNLENNRGNNDENLKKNQQKNRTYSKIKNQEKQEQYQKTSSSKNENKRKETNNPEQKTQQEKQDGMQLPLLDNDVVKREAYWYWHKLDPKLWDKHNEILNNNIYKMIKEGQFEFQIYTDIKKPDEDILTPDKNNIKNKFLFPLFIYQDRLLDLGYTFASLTYYDKPQPTIVAKIQKTEQKEKEILETKDTISINNKLLVEVKKEINELSNNFQYKSLGELPGFDYFYKLPINKPGNKTKVNIDILEKFNQDMEEIFGNNSANTENAESLDISDYPAIRKLQGLYNNYFKFGHGELAKFRNWQKQFEQNIHILEEDQKTKYKNEQENHPNAMSIEIEEKQLLEASNKYYKQQTNPEKSREIINSEVKKAIDNIKESNKIEFSLEYDDIFNDNGFTNDFLNRIAAYMKEAQQYKYIITDWYCYKDKNDTYKIVGRLENQEQKIKDEQALNKLKWLTVEGAILFGLTTLGNLFIDGYWNALKWIWDTTTSPISISNLEKGISGSKGEKPKKKGTQKKGEKKK